MRAWDFLDIATRTLRLGGPSWRAKLRFIRRWWRASAAPQESVSCLEVVNTYRCNARCAFCSLAEMGDFASDMSDAVFERLVAESVREGVRLMLFLGGESLVDRRFIGMLRRCREQGIATGLQTNGILLTIPTLEALHEAGVKSICVTMHGDAPGTHDSVYGVAGGFETVMAAIAYAAEHDITIKLKAIYSKASLADGSFEAILALARRHGLELNVNPYMPVGRGFDESQRLSDQEVARFRRLVATDPLCTSHVFGRRDMQGCFAGTGYFAVMANGDLLPCYFLPLSVGNIMHTDFARARAVVATIPIFAQRLPVCFVAESPHFFSAFLRPLYESEPTLPVDLTQRPDLWERLKRLSLADL